LDESTISFEYLLSIVRRLLGPDGCPWDRQQTVVSASRYLVEEAWEFLDAVERGDGEGMEEELGDVLMIAVLLAEIAASEGRFTLSGACRKVTEKLIRRHPHVFGNARFNTPGEVKTAWRDLKREEGKGEAPDGLPRLPQVLPALTQAVKIGKAASELGFDWPDQAGPMSKITEEWEELKQAVAKGDKAAISREVGDLLFAVSSLCRKTGTDPENALRAALERFRRRFAKVYEGIAEGRLKDLAAMERTWKEAKAESDLSSGRDSQGASGVADREGGEL